MHMAERRRARVLTPGLLYHVIYAGAIAVHPVGVPEGRAAPWRRGPDAAREAGLELGLPGPQHGRQRHPHPARGACLVARRDARVERVGEVLGEVEELV